MTDSPTQEQIARQANRNVKAMLFEAREMAREHPARAVLQEMVWASTQFAQGNRVCADCYVGMVAAALSKCLGRRVGVLVVEAVDDDDDDDDEPEAA